MTLDNVRHLSRSESKRLTLRLSKLNLWLRHCSCFPALPKILTKIQVGTPSASEFSDVSLNQWLRRVPSEMLKAHLNIDKATAMKIPAEKLVVI